MKIPATRRDASIWYAFFNDPRSHARRPVAAAKPAHVKHRARQPGPAENEASGLAAPDPVFGQLLQILRDMKQEERRHLEVLSRARALSGTPELAQLLARNVAQIEGLVARLEKVLRQSGCL